MSQQCEDPLNKFVAKDRDLPACPMRSAGNANSQMQILAFRGVSGPKARHDSVDGLAKGTGHYAINSGRTGDAFRGRVTRPSRTPVKQSQPSKAKKFQQRVFLDSQRDISKFHAPHRNTNHPVRGSGHTCGNATSFGDDLVPAPFANEHLERIQRQAQQISEVWELVAERLGTCFAHPGTGHGMMSSPMTRDVGGWNHVVARPNGPSSSC